jgi:hypothetical protein
MVSGNGNNGVVHGATLVPDRFGNPNNAYYFNGVANYIEVKDNGSFDLMTALTISAWINPSVIQNKPAGVVSKGRRVTDTGFRLGVNADNKANLGLNNDHGHQSGYYNCAVFSEPLMINKWVHVSVTWNGITMKIYLNGKLQKSDDKCANSPLLHSSQPLNIGREAFRPDERYFNGVVDSIYLYNRALTEEEIKLLYEMKNDKKPPPDIPVNDVPWEWLGPFSALFGSFIIGVIGASFVCCICKLSRNRNKNKHKYKRLSIEEEKFDDIEMKRQRIFDSDNEDHEIPNPLEELRKERERNFNIIKENRGKDILTKSIELLKQEKEDTPVTLNPSVMFFNQKKGLKSEQKNDDQIQKQVLEKEKVVNFN